MEGYKPLLSARCYGVAKRDVRSGIATCLDAVNLVDGESLRKVYAVNLKRGASVILDTHALLRHSLRVVEIKTVDRAVGIAAINDVACRLMRHENDIGAVGNAVGNILPDIELISLRGWIILVTDGGTDVEYVCITRLQGFLTVDCSQCRGVCAVDGNYAHAITARCEVDRSTVAHIGREGELEGAVLIAVVRRGHVSLHIINLHGPAILNVGTLSSEVVDVSLADAYAYVLVAESVELNGLVFAGAQRWIHRRCNLVATHPLSIAVGDLEETNASGGASGAELRLDSNLAGNLWRYEQVVDGTVTIRFLVHQFLTAYLQTAGATYSIGSAEVIFRIGWIAIRTLDAIGEVSPSRRSYIVAFVVLIIAAVGRSP